MMISVLGRRDLWIDGQSYRLEAEVDAVRLRNDLADAMRADTVVETQVEVATGRVSLLLRPGNAKIVYITGLDPEPSIGKPGH
jgi:hypothetical protein